MLKKLMFPVMGLSLGLSGCGAVRFLAYLFSPPEPKKTVRADFAGLQGRSVAVVVYADESTRAEYPYPDVRLSVGQQVEARLTEHVKGVSVIDSQRVVRYQNQDTDWSSRDRTHLGKVFNADYVLLVSLVRYAMRDPGMLDSYRGRIVAEASLYETATPEADARRWYAADFEAVYPEPSRPPLTHEQAGDLRYRVERIFAEALVGKFYTHKEPVER